MIIEAIIIAIYVVCGAVMVVAAGLQIWVWTRKGKPAR